MPDSGTEYVRHREFELEQRRVDNLREADSKAVLAALNAAEKAVDAALAAAEKATTLARTLQEDKNQASNEWRQAMNDLIQSQKEALAVIVATLVTKSELELRLDSAAKDVAAEKNVKWGRVVGVVVAIATVVGVFMPVLVLAFAHKL